jgi:hypothetical protein
MEPNQPLATNDKSLWDQTTIIVVVVALAILGMGLYFSLRNSSDNNTISPPDIVQEEPVEAIKTSDLPANVSETASGLLEEGEVVFVVSSQNNETLREIQIHNPYYDSWILVYDGYRQVSPIPVEVYRTVLAPVQYDRITIRTTNNYHQLNKNFTPLGGGSIIVGLDI